MGHFSGKELEKDRAEALDLARAECATLRAACARVEQQRDAIIQALGTVVVLRVPTPEECVARVEEIRARLSAAEALIAKMDACLKGHLIGINCHGPCLDEETIAALRAALAPKETP